MKILVMFTFVLLSVSSFGQAQISDEDYFTIGEISTELIAEEGTPQGLFPKCQTPQGLFQTVPAPKAGTILKDAGTVIALGEKILKIIENNQPVIKSSSQVFSAMPSKAVKLSDEELVEQTYGWCEPLVQRFRSTYKNLYGLKVVDFEYSIKMIYGGGVDESSDFIKSLIFTPEKIDTAWGYTFDASAIFMDSYNAGTKENILAVLDINFEYKVSTLVKKSVSTDSYSFYANGKVVKH